jgi:hypothetical protein
MIKGHSVFDVNLFYDNKFFIKKSTKIEKERLKKQIEKQINFPKNNLYNIPFVFETKYLDDSFVAIMEYYYYDNFIDFFNKSSLLDINLIIDKIINIIEYFILNSEIKHIDYEIFLKKYDLTKKNIINNNINYNFDWLDFIFNKKTELFLPIGLSHGDLTLSNILFKNNDILLIDFLDSFIETPLNDIVKIRQDTKFFWSQNLYQKYYDEKKLEIILNFFDEKIDTHFKKYDFYLKYYKMFEIMNLLRILQYTKEKNITNKIIQDLENEKFNYTDCR